MYQGAGEGGRLGFKTEGRLIVNVTVAELLRDLPSLLTTTTFVVCTPLSRLLKLNDVEVESACFLPSIVRIKRSPRLVFNAGELGYSR